MGANRSEALPAFSAPPTITGTSIRLRPFRDADHDALWSMVNDEEGNRLTGTHAAFTREAIDRWYRSRALAQDRLDLAIATLDEDTCVGEVVLHELDAPNASCAFRISLVGPHVFGRGFGSEATQLILGHAFDEVGLHRVELEVYAFNTRAYRVYRKAGFAVEGVRRGALLWDGAFHDAVLMAALATDWRASHHEHHRPAATRRPAQPRPRSATSTGASR